MSAVPCVESRIYQAPVSDVWVAARRVLCMRNVRRCDEAAMTIEANLGMKLTTGSVIAVASVTDTPDGAEVTFRARMGAMSGAQYDAPKRLETERADFFAELEERLAAITPAPPPEPMAAAPIAPAWPTPQMSTVSAGPVDIPALTPLAVPPPPTTASNVSTTSPAGDSSDHAPFVAKLLRVAMEHPLAALIVAVLALAPVFAVTNALGITDTTNDSSREAATAPPAASPTRQSSADSRVTSTALSESPVDNDPDLLSAVRQFMYVNGLCATKSCPEARAAGPVLFSFYVDVNPSVSAVDVCTMLLSFASDDVVVWSGSDRRAEGDPRHDVRCVSQ